MALRGITNANSFIQPALEGCDKFDLHGYLIFDNYSPISCPPSKGVKAPLAPLDTVPDPNVGDSKQKIHIVTSPGLAPKILRYFAGRPSITRRNRVKKSQLKAAVYQAQRLVEARHEWLSERSSSKNRTTPLVAQSGYISAVSKQAQLVGEVSIPTQRRTGLDTTFDHTEGYGGKGTSRTTTATPELIEAALFLNAEDVAGEDDGQDEEDDDEEEVIERNTDKYNHGSRSSNHHKNDDGKWNDKKRRSKPGFADDDEKSMESIRDPAGDLLGELKQTQEFIGSLLVRDGMFYAQSSSYRDVEVDKWVSTLIHKLAELESRYALAAIVVAEVTTEGALKAGWNRDAESLETFCERFMLADLFPTSFQQKLRMPAILCVFPSAEYRKVIEDGRISGTINGAITPLPLKRGDHIYREIQESGVLRYLTHHGIYTGNGRIIHFSGNELSLKTLFGSSSTAKIKSTDIVSFMKHGNRLRVRTHKKSDPADIVIYRAEAAVAEQHIAKYNILMNNCEHFCFYCKTGKGRSKQVEAGVMYTVAGALIIATGVVAAAALGGRRR